MRGIQPHCCSRDSMGHCTGPFRNRIRIPDIWGESREPTARVIILTYLHHLQCCQKLSDSDARDNIISFTYWPLKDPGNSYLL